MKVNDEFYAYLHHVLGEERQNEPMDDFGPMEVIEWLWPLNDLLLPHKALIDRTAYSTAAEEECDNAMLALALRPNAETLRPLSPAGWRVFHDRHVGFLAVVAANKAAGRLVFVSLPRRLPAESRLPCMLLMNYLRFPAELLPAS
jgi:hypothetical protein